MGIAATPTGERFPKFDQARRGIAETMVQHGLQGTEASECVIKTMAALYALVQELETRRRSLDEKHRLVRSH